MINGVYEIISLPHSWQFLMQQLDDIAAVKNYVIRADHAALYHDSIPARHLEHKS